MCHYQHFLPYGTLFSCFFIVFIVMQGQSQYTDRSGSVVTHESRIREVPGSNRVAGQPGWGFSGFLNLKIAKEFFSKENIGLVPIIHYYWYNLMFTVSRDLKPLLSKWWTSNACSSTDGSVIWSRTVAHRLGCLISWLFTSDVAWRLL